MDLIIPKRGRKNHSGRNWAGHAGGKGLAIWAGNGLANSWNAGPQKAKEAARAWPRGVGGGQKWEFPGGWGGKMGPARGWPSSWPGPARFFAGPWVSSWGFYKGKFYSASWLPCWAPGRARLKYIIYFFLEKIKNWPTPNSAAGQPGPQQNN